MNQKNKQTKVYQALLATSILSITYLATAPLDYPTVGTAYDKLNHLFAFFVLGLLADFSFPESNFGYVKIAPLFGYGIFIEVIQLFLPDRMFSLFDIAADSAGLLLYAVCIPLFRKFPVLKGRWD